MNMENREETFLRIFREGMLASQQKETLATLGNRNLYLGLSDLAKYQECPRAAVAAKIMDQSRDINSLLACGRGHWFEDGIAKCFSALQLNQMRQLEISHENKGVPIKAHLDIALVWEKPYPAVRILEIKSMEKLPDTPYPSHQWQILAQEELLKRCWNQPAFGFANTEKMDFPSLCKDAFGISLPIDMKQCSIEGWLLCISMTEAKAFGSFSSDREFMQNMHLSAFAMWQQVAQLQSGQLDLKDIPHATGYYPLCSWCRVSNGCPKFTVGVIKEELEPVLANLDQLKDRRASLDVEIREIESSLKLAYHNSEISDWISTNGHRFRVINAKGRTTLDMELLKAELEDLFHTWGIESETVKSFLERCEKVGAPSSRLSIQPIKQDN